MGQGYNPEYGTEQGNICEWINYAFETELKPPNMRWLKFHFSVLNGEETVAPP